MVSLTTGSWAWVAFNGVIAGRDKKGKQKKDDSDQLGLKGGVQ